MKFLREVRSAGGKRAFRQFCWALGSVWPASQKVLQNIRKIPVLPLLRTWLIEGFAAIPVSFAHFICSFCLLPC